MASQWEEEGARVSGLVVVDSPLPNGAYVTRFRQLVDGLGGVDEGDFLGRVIAQPQFETIFDEQHGLGCLRTVADSATVERVFRIHAANATALAQHRPRTVRAPLWYALALRADNARSQEEALRLLGTLSSGPLRALGFDCDHFSIMRSPALEAVAGFFGMASSDLEQPVPLVAE
jgi:thioesterase domain-containing protein